jgi:Rad3-related DNA helicase
MANRDQEILTAFKVLGFSPRNNQVEIINDIVSAYLDDKKKNVILCAGTGIGKSIIAAVVAEVMKTVAESNLSGIYLSSTNQLIDQYGDSFKHLPEMKFFRIKGARNYGCQYFIERGNKFATGEDCVKTELSEMEENKYCKNCMYDQNKKIINKTQNLITNYSYFLISKLKSEHLMERNLQVFDEAHLLNETFCSQVSIDVSVDLLDKLCTLLNDLNGKADNQKADLVLFKKDIERRAINISNYKVKINELLKIYQSIVDICSHQAALIPDLKAKIKVRKVGSRFSRLGDLIVSFFEHDYDHVFDDTVDKQISIKPIFVSDMMHLLLGRFNLFMSATISKSFAKTTFNLDPADTAYINPEDVFPKENKPIFFIGKENLNYQKMKDPQTFKDMAKVIQFIVDHHKGDKGIILVPSFYASKMLSNAIPKSVRLFLHEQGTNSAEIVESFRKHTGSGVLMSPSIFEGLDFKDDESRYQIVCKTPYASLGDLRVKKIADSYGDIYREMTLYKILQGMGRSIRSSEDTAATYFLDKSSETLFKSTQNIWKDRYEIKR